MTKVITARTIDDALFGLASEVRQNEAREERTLVFCEDRLTLLAEGAVIDGTGGTFLTDVVTFRRFLNNAGRRKLATLSKQGSVLEIAALMAQHEDKLGCFKKSAAQAVYETIAQLSASCVDEDLLRRSAEDVDVMLAKKLGDLAFLLEEYHAFLRDKGMLDENGYLALLPSALAAGCVGTNVIFFAFPAFTRQAREGIRAALTCARSVTGIFLDGEEEFYTGEAAAEFTRVAEEFGAVERKSVPTSLGGAARAMHRCLFSAGRPSHRIGGGHVRVMTPSDENSEMETIAAHIKRLTREEGLRYRDIAVFVSGQEYLLAAKKAFEAFRIPYYADVKRTFSEHPFCTFVLSVLEGVADGVLPDEADDIASSVYFGDGGNYRNYLRRFCAFRGGVTRAVREEEELRGDFGSREVLLACRERMNGALKLFRARGMTGAQYAEAIAALWKFVDGETVTERLREELPADERAFLEIAPLWNILRETEEVVGEAFFKPREFSRLLRSGLEALSVDLLPQRADAVFVGDVTDSKICRVKALFCAGLTDAVPRVSQDTAVITDDEIARLGRLQVEIDPAIAVVNARAREAFALNLCAFSEDIFLSCPTRLKGKEAARSEIFYYIEKTFDVAPMPEVFPYDCSEFAPAMLAFFRETDALGGEKDAATAYERIRRFSSVREALLHPARADWEATDPAALRDGSSKPATAEAARLWLMRELSPTAMEDYFDCPYKGFAMRALRVEETSGRSVLGSADAGSFVHTVLERTAKFFNAIADEGECRALAEEIARTLLQEPAYAALTDTPAGNYTAERLIGEAVEVAAVCHSQLTRSKYRVRATEYSVSLPALGLGGKTDRVDESGDLVRVIDYKTGAIDDSPVAYYTGRKLQLELYLSAAAEGGRAAGAFYFPAADDLCAEGENKFCMKGFYCKDPEVVEGLDTGRGEGKSEIFESGTRDKALPREKFEHFLGYASLVLQGAREELAAGNISPSPYDGACTYCKLKGMCGFVREPRKEKNIKPAEIADIAACCEQKEDTHV